MRILFRLEQKCWKEGILSPMRDTWRLYFSECPLKALLWDVKARPAFHLRSWWLDCFSGGALFSLWGYLSAASKHGLSEGWTGRSCALSAHFLLSSFPVLWQKSYLLHLVPTWHLPAALLEMEAGKGELGKTQQQFFMQESGLNKF